MQLFATSLALFAIGMGIFSLYLGLVRVANQLERIADKLNTDPTAELYNQVEQMAWHAGRSFEQGRRTDR